MIVIVKFFPDMNIRKLMLYINKIIVSGSDKMTKCGNWKMCRCGFSKKGYDALYPGGKSTGMGE